MRKLVILGTGFAMATKCFNTCFFLELEDGSLFLTDAGGGNGILRQLEVTNFDYNKCHHMFVTHGHTDHIVGCVWVVRKIAAMMNKGDIRLYNEVEGLKSASGLMRKEIGRQVKIRHTPELIFKIDSSMEYGRRISKVIDELDIKPDSINDEDMPEKN